MSVSGINPSRSFPINGGLFTLLFMNNNLQSVHDLLPIDLFHGLRKRHGEDGVFHRKNCKECFIGQVAFARSCSTFSRPIAPSVLEPGMTIGCSEPFNRAPMATGTTCLEEMV